MTQCCLPATTNKVVKRLVWTDYPLRHWSYEQECLTRLLVNRLPFSAVIKEREQMGLSDGKTQRVMKEKWGGGSVFYLQCSAGFPQPIRARGTEGRVGSCCWRQQREREKEGAREWTDGSSSSAFSLTVHLCALRWPSSASGTWLCLWPASPCCLH